MIALQDIRFLGRGLNRPECVLTHSSGYLIASDVTGSGGISVISPDGRVRKILAKSSDHVLKPNGIALLPGGAVLLAHLGADDGGLYRLDPDGRTEAVLTEVAGLLLPPTNFVMYDGKGRTWATISTRKHPRQLDYRPEANDGFIVVQDARGARIVADGLGYTNECAIHPDGEHLYVNETFARRVSAFRIGGDGSLTDRRVVATFGPGTFPDGLTFDREGGLWITSIVSNRVILISPDGSSEIMLEDSDAEQLASVEHAFRNNFMGREHLEPNKGRVVRNLSSLAFGGEGLATAYLGTLAGESIPFFRAPIAGHPLPHWNFDIEPLKF